MTNGPKTIFVTGDWVADWSLARSTYLPEGYFDGSLETQLHHRAGGAWYVAHLIEHVSCRDLTASPSPSLKVTSLRDVADSKIGVNHHGDQSDDLAHAYSVWWKQQQCLDAGKKDAKVWRLGDFAGCRRSTTWKPPVAAKVAPSASLLVIDDLGLGFSKVPEAIEHVTSYAGTEAKILLKQEVRPDDSGLLPELLRIGLAERLHVVTGAGALRRRNAALTRSLSWDKVLEDVEAELTSGPSSRDLARCAEAIVHFGLAGAAVFHFGKLHRFYFLPDELEGVWENARPGYNFGTGSVLTACIARHLVGVDDYPMFFAVTQALAAQRVAHHEGAGSGDELDLNLPYGPRTNGTDPAKNPAAACIAPPPKPLELKPGERPPVEQKCVTCVEHFRVAWNPSDLKVWLPAVAPGLQRSRLLCNATGTTPEALHVKALEVVLQGQKKALAAIPRAIYGDYITADREEIESINEIRRLILEYKANPKDKNPLSIAVFGAPGSGKSFAIKQIAKAIFGKDKEPLEFNLTQIKTPGELHHAFHQVRDASIRLEIPLVFWDEFDTAGLQWLANFLAPMQDHEFFDGSHKHPFGKCIFIFAGGTRTNFKNFKEWADEPNWVPTDDQRWHDSFKAVKGPDFVSRLRGFVDVKGPNPVPPRPKATEEECIKNDPAYVLRRAIVLRGEIERNYPQLIHPNTERAAISPNVLHALLSVARYEHGGRSISNLLSMCDLSRVKAFNVSALPARDLLHLHVSKDFQDRLAEPIWTEELLISLAQAGWRGWKLQKPISLDVVEPAAHSDLVTEWDLLAPSAKTDNLDPVPRRLLELQQLGYSVVPRAAGSSYVAIDSEETDALIDKLIDPEHRIWLSRRLTDGWEGADVIRRYLRQHPDIQPFKDLEDSQKALNRAIISHTLAAFEPAGYCLVRMPPKNPESANK